MKRNRPRTMRQLDKRIFELETEQKLIRQSVRSNLSLSRLIIQNGVFRIITIAGIGLASATLLKSLKNEIDKQPLGQVLLSLVEDIYSLNGVPVTEEEKQEAS